VEEQMQTEALTKTIANCYQNGEFTFNGTVNEFQEFCRQKMVESGQSKFLAWLFTRGMKRLERWKNK
jgi:hypothetical protein